MARLAAWATHEDPFEIGAVANGIAAGTITVRRNVTFMERDIAGPGGRMFQIDAAQMAERAGRAAIADTRQGRTMARGVGASGRPVGPGIIRV